MSDGYEIYFSRLLPGFTVKKQDLSYKTICSGTIKTTKYFL
jgi:hypothetical protein